jgi:hypothetical protein
MKKRYKITAGKISIPAKEKYPQQLTWTTLNVGDVIECSEEAAAKLVKHPSAVRLEEVTR